MLVATTAGTVHRSSESLAGHSVIAVLCEPGDSLIEIKSHLTHSVFPRMIPAKSGEHQVSALDSLRKYLLHEGQ